MSVAGIDPGTGGGIAAIGSAGYDAWKMPETEQDLNDLFKYLATQVSFALIEAVHANPMNGSIALFKLGRSYGFLRGMLIAHRIPFEEVSPQKWQKALGCLTHGDKNISKAKAQQLFPALKITHKTADALLIAEYARRTHQGYKEPAVNLDDL